MLQRPQNPDGDGICRPLGRASERGHLEIMRLLLEARANIDGRDMVGGQTALHHACGGGNVEAVSLLLAAGANKDAVSDSGYTPLHMACRCRHAKVVRLLLEAGVRPGARTRGITAFQFAVGRSRLRIRRLLSMYRWSRRRVGADHDGRATQHGSWVKRPPCHPCLT